MFNSQNTNKTKNEHIKIVNMPTNIVCRYMVLCVYIIATSRGLRDNAISFD